MIAEGRCEVRLNGHPSKASKGDQFESVHLLENFEVLNA